MFKKRTLNSVIVLCCVLYFSGLHAQDATYKSYKDSLYTFAKNNNIKVILKTIDSALIYTKDVDRISILKSTKLLPLIESGSFIQATALSDSLLNSNLPKYLKITVRLRRALIYEFIADYDKSKAELDIVNTLFNQEHTSKTEEYGEMLYRYSSLYRGHNRKEDAKTYINESIAFGETHNFNNVLATAYLVKSILTDVEDLEQRETLLHKSLESAKATNYKIDLMASYYKFSGLYRYNEPLKALKYIDSTLQYEDIFPTNYLTSNTYKIKSDCYLALNEPKKALESYQKYHEIAFDNYQVQGMFKISELEYKFNLEKEEIQRDQVFKDNKEIQNINSKLKWSIISLCVLLVLLTISIFFILKRNEIIKSNREHISNTNLQLTKNVKEKEILLKELHHRVKNNLALILSLVNFQALEIDDEASIERFKTLKQRIEAIAAVHQQMLGKSNSELDDMHNINEYLNTIAKSLINVHTKAVQFSPQIADVEVATDVAVPIGILINELISNSLKHANKQSNTTITLKISETKNELEIIYSDNGKQFKIDPNKKSLGLFIIESMVTQLKGTLHRKDTLYTIKVKKQKRDHD